MAESEPRDPDVSEVLHRIGKKYSAEILEATATPRSAKELSEQLEVPIATCYRRIDELTDSGLLVQADSVLTEDRRRVDVFRRNVDRITVEFREGSATVSVAERTAVKNRIDEVWRSLPERD